MGMGDVANLGLRTAGEAEPVLQVVDHPASALELTYPQVAVPAGAPPIGAARPWSDAAKRTLDIVVSATVLLIFLPLLVLMAVAVRLDTPGSPIFLQTRLGRGRRPFPLLKFRTMHLNAEELLRQDPELYAIYVANDWKLPKGTDPRITRVGAALRATSLDELPQLVNVLLVHMSLVGPRPPVTESISNVYGDDEELYFTVRPGLTGAWQVGGRSDLTVEEHRAIDVDYIQNRSFGRDLRILFATIPAVLTQRGAC
jgi:exopolysaccharide production protein ExoY